MNPMATSLSAASRCGVIVDTPSARASGIKVKRRALVGVFIFCVVLNGLYWCSCLKEGGDAAVDLDGIFGGFAGSVEYLHALKILVFEAHIAESRVETPMPITLRHEIQRNAALDADF